MRPNHIRQLFAQINGHMPVQSHATMPPPSQVQACPRLAPGPARTRRPDLDHTQRTHLHDPPRHLPRL